MKLIVTSIRFLALGLIRFYQGALSPALPSSCRFHPSCSQYAYEAVEKWGTARGVTLALGRLLRCQPLGGFGYDPVPEPGLKRIGRTGGMIPIRGTR